jgi:predicted AAA+ superfamily ATPase
MLETFVFSELLKSYWHNGRCPNLYFYRDADQREVDFVFERNMTLYPVEVKKSASPSLAHVRSFNALKRLKKDIGHGAGHLSAGGPYTAFPACDRLQYWLFVIAG